MSILHDIFKNAYPDASDEDIDNEVAGLGQGAEHGLSSALSSIPGASSLADIVSNAPALWNKVKNSNMVQDASKALTGESINGMVPNPGNPISDVAQGAITGGLKDLLNPTQDPTPTPPAPAASTVTPDATPDASPAPASPAVPPVAQAKQAADAGAKTDNSDELAAAMSVAPKSDAEAELAAREKRKHDIGLIPVAGAGIGDAISSAASAFGARGNTGTQEKVKEDIDNSIVKDKAAFEEKQKKDPNSDISKHYQKVLGLMLGDKAKAFNVSSMSAENIASTLPEVEKYMQKELGMAQVRSNKELATSMKDRDEQDKLYQQSLQNLNSVRGDSQLQKIEAQRDAATAAFNRLAELKARGEEPNPVDYTDILGQIYKARTGAAPTQEIMKAINQSTASGKLNHAYTFVTGRQAPATTADIAHSLQSMAFSMGQQADKLHDGYMRTRTGDAISPRLNADDRERLGKLARGMSFAEATKDSGTVNMKPEDVQAVKWAKANPDDPRAQTILKIHGM